MNPAAASVLVAAAGLLAAPVAATVPEPVLASLMEQSGPLAAFAYVLLVRLRRIEQRLDNLRRDVEDNSDQLAEQPTPRPGSS